jgi:hypothetical protein
VVVLPSWIGILEEMTPRNKCVRSVGGANTLRTLMWIGTLFSEIIIYYLKKKYYGYQGS